ncbi:MAG: ribonuclease Z [Planctomycetota bacterium]|jgi:ribonuclease Z
MHFYFLGTSSGTPSRERNVTGLAMRFEQESTWSLFDCGEGTQHQLLQAPYSLPSLRRIFISHLHGDHTYGLFGLLSTRSMISGCEPIDVYGPHGIQELVLNTLRLSSSHLSYELNFHEVDPLGGLIMEQDWGRVDAFPLSHNVTSFAWKFSEFDTPGRFDAQRAREAGVPNGPLLGKLKAGETVTLPSGDQLSPVGLVGPPRAGRNVVIAGDNDDPASLLDRTGALDLFVHEATHTEAARAAAAKDIRHSTAARVAQAAEDRVRNLVLTHFSPRFTLAVNDDRPNSMKSVEDEARAHYKGELFLAQDHDAYRLNRDGALLSGS